MMAAVLTSIPSRQLKLIDLGSPRPGQGEALLAVRACGICGTDLHIMAGESYRPELPFVLGHEFMGTVLEGPATDRDWIGARVVPTLFSGCGLCEACRDGDERLCFSGPTIVGVLGRPGGFAGQAVVPFRHLVRVPEALSDEVAAALVDAGPTACNAARLAMEACSYGEPLHLVLGGGPVGLLVSEVLRAKGQPAVVVEPNQARRGELMARGFMTQTTLPSPPDKFTSVIDCVGAPNQFAHALELLRPRGRYLCVGYSAVPDIDLAHLSHYELEIKGVRSGARADLKAVLSMVQEGAVKPPPVATWPLEEVNAAFSALRDGQVVGKAVITMAPAARPL
jgi:2-desacetyl-2-hydroxyethyl bacteriochlorophyllide A dehydrogenase